MYQVIVIEGLPVARPPEVGKTMARNPWKNPLSYYPAPKTKAGSGLKCPRVLKSL